MENDVSERLQHLELAQVASASITNPSPSAPGETRAPELPPELVAEIIDLTVELLIEEERHFLSQTPLTNHFLLSAALVDRTWHSIASLALLNNGLVTPTTVFRFLAHVDGRGMTGVLDRVRFGTAVRLVLLDWLYRD
ncbi:hypothetical protein RQP46_004328 [Phenoliferia psychrophenolica]